MVSRVNTKTSQLTSWLNRVFPPSSPRVTQPQTMDEEMKLFMPALPPSLWLERADIVALSTVNPATFLTFPVNGVQRGRAIWAHCVTWEVATAVQTAQGKAFISVRKFGVPGTEVHMAMGHFDQSTLLTPLSSHAIQQGAGIASAAIGGGCGGFFIPQGMELHCSTAGTPAATTTYLMKILYTEFDIGELCLGVS
jgi:hypothetical protein